jgi:uncharacterized protein YprB with RNaseH-like and TPR domain
MLKNTFSHIPGIGIKTEKRIWNLGIYDWDDADDLNPEKISHIKGVNVGRYLEESLVHLQKEDPGYFSKRLPSNLHWRFFPEFRRHAAYLDIETTGLSNWENEITTISLYDGKDVFYYINDENLSSFPEDIEKYKLLVTYNGKSFDLPFIERYFNIRLNCAHIDLRFILHSLGLKGGLKGCERQMGIDRGILNGVDGFFAVLLWDDYLRTRNRRALETLLAYNIYDVLSLEELMVAAYNMKLLETPFHESHRIENPKIPMNPFSPDLYTIERIRKSLCLI